MTVESIERDFREKVSAQIRLAAEGLDRFRVFTPFLLDDGDHLAIKRAPAATRRRMRVVAVSGPRRRVDAARPRRPRR